MTEPRPPRDWPFVLGLAILGGAYLALIAAMLIADFTATSTGSILAALARPDVRFALRLSLLSCTLAALLSLWVGVPLGYLLSRMRFPGKWLCELLIDVPVVLPPLVVGLSLFILFQTAPGQAFQRVLPTTFAIPAVVLAQFTVSAAFAVRTMRATFDQISPRAEQVALTLGCSRARAFWTVVLPQARRGVLMAGTLAWARALGEFGPVLIFAGATHFQTEVLPTTVYLEMESGNVEAALAVSMVMLAAAGLVLLVLRVVGSRGEAP